MNLPPYEPIGQDPQPLHAGDHCHSTSKKVRPDVTVEIALKCECSHEIPVTYAIAKKPGAGKIVSMNPLSGRVKYTTPASGRTSFAYHARTVDGAKIPTARVSVKVKNKRPVRRPTRGAAGFESPASEPESDSASSVWSDTASVEDESS